MARPDLWPDTGGQACLRFLLFKQEQRLGLQALFVAPGIMEGAATKSRFSAARSRAQRDGLFRAFFTGIWSMAEHRFRDLSGRIPSLSPVAAAFRLCRPGSQHHGQCLELGGHRWQLFALGRAGERFAVRNAGGHTVAEGVGDHGCEYTTGGLATVLEAVGSNFGAGVTGGFAYALHLENTFVDKYNHESVEIQRVHSGYMEEYRNHLHQVIEEFRRETNNAAISWMAVWTISAEVLTGQTQGGSPFNDLLWSRPCSMDEKRCTQDARPWEMGRRSALSAGFLAFLGIGNPGKQADVP